MGEEVKDSERLQFGEQNPQKACMKSSSILNHQTESQKAQGTCNPRLGWWVKIFASMPHFETFKGQVCSESEITLSGGS